MNEREPKPPNRTAEAYIQTDVYQWIMWFSSKILFSLESYMIFDAENVQLRFMCSFPSEFIK